MMKRIRLSMIGLAAVLLASPAFASFHVMKIEQAMGGVSGDTSQQAVQLRMRTDFQNLLGGNARIVARDAAGSNPIVLIAFGANVANFAQGARVLIVSSAFAAAQASIDEDFIMTNTIPPSYLAAGRLTFEDTIGTVYWSLAWGGASYTGPNTGDFTNDPNGNFGPPFAGALPSGTTQALRFSTADPTGAAASNTNAADYSVTAGAATFTNNAGASGTVSSPPMADLSITKTDGNTTASPGQPITYTIVATNAGPDPAPGATVVDTPPPSLTAVSWTCVGAGGGTCSAAGLNTINDPVNLPVGATVTYTLNGTVAPQPTTLRNTATVDEPPTVGDPNPDNNSATDSDVVLCGIDTVVVPDGRVTSHMTALVAAFAATVTIGNSYSVEFRDASGDGTPPGSVTVFSGDDGCSSTSTLTVRDTSVIDPTSGTPGTRVSFTAVGTETLFRAKLTGGPVQLTLTWSDTTMYSPAWTTAGAFDTFYSFQNTTGFMLNGVLTLFDTGGVVVSTANLTIAAGQTASTNTSTLGTDRNHAGTARFTHDGPPGGIVAEAAIANFSISPAYVQPVKFQAVREAAH